MCIGAAVAVILQQVCNSMHAHYLNSALAYTCDQQILQECIRPNVHRGLGCKVGLQIASPYQLICGRTGGVALKISRLVYFPSRHPSPWLRISSNLQT